MSSLLFLTMLITTSIISKLNEVPREWVFEYYLKLEEKLTGQDLKIKSVFNPLEKNPSMCIFYSQVGGVYKFKDFSTDKSGDSVSLVQMLFNLSSKGEAAHKIIQDYNQWLLVSKDDYNLREFKIRAKYKVSQFLTRGWNSLDKNYWSKYGIGSRILDKYRVVALDHYLMSKEEDNETKELMIKGQYIYGYFRNDGTLYKIYQPKVSDNKFIKVKEYIQGTDQLSFNTDYLVICSSLKDMMTLMSMGISNVECIAPDSENTLISEHVIHSYKARYKGICTLFDNDEPGINAMAKYKSKYGLNSAHLQLEKDLSDAVAAHKMEKVREKLIPLLKQTLQ